METNLETKFDDLILSIKIFRDEIVQIKNDNKKLNEDIQALEKEKELGYNSFNTETHILVAKKTLEDIRDNLEESRSSASYASDEASSARGCADEAESSADSAMEYARYGMDTIDELIREAEKEADNGKVQS